MFSLRMFRDAVDTFEEAEQLLMAVGAKGVAASNKVHSGVALHMLGDVEGALAALSEAERLSEQLNDPRIQALALANKAAVLADMPGGRRKARKSLRKALKLIDEIEEEAIANDLRALIESLPPI